MTFEALDADPLDPAAIAATYPFLGERGDGFVWGWWRMPTFAELAAVLPAAGPDDPARGWWPPTRDGLDERRRRLRERRRMPARPGPPGGRRGRRRPTGREADRPSRGARAEAAL